MTDWHQLNVATCKNLEEYNKKFCKALLSVTSYRFVPLTKQIEKYCCGLHKGLMNNCTKSEVATLTQLMEVANTGNALLKGEDSGFQGSGKGSQEKKISAKKSFVKATPQASQWSEKAGKDKDSANKSEGQVKRNKRKSFARKSFGYKKTLMAENKCFICEKPGHYAPDCPERKRSADSEDKEDDRKGKKPKPTAGLVPDMVGDKPSSDASELCRAWGKVRDQPALIFFGPGAKANFISPELVIKLGIKA